MNLSIIYYKNEEQNIERCLKGACSIQYRDDRGGYQDRRTAQGNGLRRVTRTGCMISREMRFFRRQKNFAIETGFILCTGFGQRRVCRAGWIIRTGKTDCRIRGGRVGSPRRRYIFTEARENRRSWIDPHIRKRIIFSLRGRDP